MDKMRFSAKTSKWTFGHEPGHTVRSVLGDFNLTCRPVAPIFLFYSCFSRKFFTYLRNPKHLEYSGTLYDPGEY